MAKKNRPTQNQVREAASSCQYKSQFREKFPRHYREARELGILEEITEHMEDRRKKWTDENIAIEASKYQTRSDFSKGSASAYATASNRGILDQVCEHMEPRKTRVTSDTIYVCRIPGTDVYKIGITNQSLGLNRIRQLKSKHKIDLELILYAPLYPGISTLESYLRALGTAPEEHFDCMEFRRLSKSDFQKLMKLIYAEILKTHPPERIT